MGFVGKDGEAEVKIGKLFDSFGRRRKNETVLYHACCSCCCCCCCILVPLGNYLTERGLKKATQHQASVGQNTIISLFLLAISLLAGIVLVRPMLNLNPGLTGLAAAGIYFAGLLLYAPVWLPDESWRRRGGLVFLQFCGTLFLGFVLSVISAVVCIAGYALILVISRRLGFFLP